MDAVHPNAGDPVDDDRYPLITDTDTDADVDELPAGWDTDPALAGPQRTSDGQLEPDDAWAALQALDAGGAP